MKTENLSPTTGGIEQLREQIAQYQSVAELTKRNSALYARVRTMRRLDLLDPLRAKPHSDYWTRERTGALIAVMGSLEELVQRAPGAFVACLEKRWYDLIDQLGGERSHEPSKWHVAAVARRYHWLGHFRADHPWLYYSAWRNGWREAVSHLKTHRNRHGHAGSHRGMPEKPE